MDTYEEAVGNGQTILEMLVESARERGEALPEPRIYAGADVRETYHRE
jgi:predicted RNase H-like HicB family nuclease